MERHEVDIDNFIKEKIGGLRPPRFFVEPSPGFTGQTMRKILRLERQRYFRILYGWATVLAFGPLVLRQLWLWIRNDYFSASHLPFGSFVVPVYHFFISPYGIFLLLAVGILVSLRFILKFHGRYSSAVRTT